MITTKCIGELIEEFDIRNKDGKVNEFYGINVKKEVEKDDKSGNKE